MEQLLVKERANSLVCFMNGKRKIDSSPGSRPVEIDEIPPPMSLAPSVLENSKKIKELMAEKEQDLYLIDVLKKLSFEQAKEIERLKGKIENVQKDYEKLFGDRERRVSVSIFDTISRSRSESVNE